MRISIQQTSGMMLTSVIVLVVIMAVAGKCPDTDTVCEWNRWSEWSECSATCGGRGFQSRRRALCCKVEWIEAGTCKSECDMYDNYDRRSCGDHCFNSGRLKPTGYGCECLDRSFGHCCEQILAGCTPYPTDIIFLLDSSASQTKEQFHKQLDFVKKFVEHINVSWEEFQVSVVTFSTDARVEINFNRYITKGALLNIIEEIEYRPGATFTDKGLNAALNVARRSERRAGMVTLTYVFVLTDGMSNKRAETKLAASKLKTDGIRVIAIGIGKEVSHQELVDIASPGDQYSSSYVFSVSDFNALDTLLKQLVQLTCDDCSATSHLSDIVFLLDESNDMSETEFQLSVDAMTSMVESSKHIGEADGSHFGLVKLENTAKTIIELSGGQSQNTIQVELQTLQRRQNGVCDKDKQCNRSNVTLATEQILKNFYSTNGREYARKFLVVLSNGKFEDPKIVKEEMAAIHELSDVKLFVIGPGLDVNMNGLLSLAKEANHVFIVLDRNDLLKLDVMQSEFSYNFCKKT